MSPLDPAVLQAAVDWRVRQESGQLTAQEQAAFSDWLGAAPQHQAAWQRLDGTLAGPLGTVRQLSQHHDGAHTRAALQTLYQPRRRRVLRGALALAGLGTVAGWSLQRYQPLHLLGADLHTATAERQHLTLPSGVAVWLDARSALDVVAANTDAHTLRLRAGAVVVDASALGTRPLLLRTADGELQTNGGQFLCRQEADATVAVALEQPLRVLPAAGRAVTLAAGQGARFTATDCTLLTGPATERAAWRDGMLAVTDQPLGEVIAQLQAHTPATLSISAAAAELRVFGVFPLDVPFVLDTLAQTLPLQVTHYGPWLTRLERRSA